MGQHIEFLVEEPSMEAFLRGLLPRVLPGNKTFDLHAFQGKSDLLGKLGARLRGYARWLPDDWSIIVLIDRDGDDCVRLKQHLERIARQSGMRTRSVSGGSPWQLANRIAIEELEAWYFGDWQAVREVYPKASSTVRNQHGYRDPDGIAGGTWEAFERVLQRHGYFKQGLRKVEVARALGMHIDCERSDSLSFRHFHEVLMEAVT